MNDEKGVLIAGVISFSESPSFPIRHTFRLGLLGLTQSLIHFFITNLCSPQDNFSSNERLIGDWLVTCTPGISLILQSQHTAAEVLP